MAKKKDGKERSLRLDKFLSEAEGISRSQARQMIRKGRVSVGGKTETRPECKVDMAVMLDGRPCVYKQYIYLMLNKPQGVVSAVRDRQERTVLDCVDSEGHDIFPVGRLDKDTEGLLLLTDDGALAHRLLSPRKHVDKCYYAILDKELGQDAVTAMKDGLDIGDEKSTLPAELRLLGPVGQVESADPDAGRQTGSEDFAQPGGFAVRIIIQEGRFHQVKRMAAVFGAKVLYLKRERMGGLTLDPSLKPGDYRPLTEDEIGSLL